jgi:hypothetical protein
MPICNKCQKFSNCLTTDFCEHCGGKDWKIESLHDKTMREHGERYAPKMGRTAEEEFLAPIVSLVRILLGSAVVIGLLLGSLWLLVALVKLMWQHS